ncbi:phage integrase SAM-like domain-containing protein [Bacillus sp. SA1-12]|uniref:tyrosine-type recombinase/integrase n=1 Tax=Bacillus sp. SA1-12 TaxID=1455638 RepID=UPI0006971FF4|nr:phage integrase SAM-like domain-containing protein [Bacillus sp. SA1-12]
MLLKFAIQDFLDDREFKNLSPATVFNYKESLKQFQTFCNEHEIANIQDITANVLKKYLLQCQKDGNRPSSINSKLRRLKAFFNYMIEIEVIIKSPVEKIKSVGI